MSRKKPLWILWKENSEHVSRIILREYELFGLDRGYQPTQHGLFTFLTEGQWNLATRKKEAARYKITQGSFDYWFTRLVEENYIQIDALTRSTKSVWLQIIEREDRPPELE